MPPRGRPAHRLIIFALALAGLLILPGAARAQATGTITGVAFKDLNRDGVKQAEEEPLAGKRIHLFSGAGAYLKNALTDATGTYRLTGLADGGYRVWYSSPDWWDLWQDWAPSTTGSERPRVELHLTGSAVADFGFRPIVRSTDVASPISSYVSPEGLRVQSYNDVVPAKRIYDALMAGSLRGGEMPHTTIRFDYRPSNYCDISAVQSGGLYGNYQAYCYIAYIQWLDQGDNGLFHEYGHAWSLYHAFVVQQDPTLSGYLQARGVLGDPRVGTSSSWSPKEMIAEDYRELFGTANAAEGSQDNLDIPRAAEVPGLREYLSGQFMQPPVAPPLPAPKPMVHIGNLTGQSAKAARGWKATATAVVRGAGGDAVDGAAVTLAWAAGKSQAGSASCVTAAGGSCSAPISLTNKVDSAAFTVKSVSKDGYGYDTDANVVVSVTVSRPR